MAEREAPDTCNGKGYSPMCCNSKSDVCVSSSLAFLLFCVSEKRVYLTCSFFLGFWLQLLQAFRGG